MPAHRHGGGCELRDASRPVEQRVGDGESAGCCPRSELAGPGRSFWRQKPGDGDVFIDFRPMDADPVSDETPVPALLRCRTQQAGKPGQRSGQFATISEPDDQTMIRDFHVRSPVLSRGSTHARSPAGTSGRRRNGIQPRAEPLARNLQSVVCAHDDRLPANRGISMAC